MSGYSSVTIKRALESMDGRRFSYRFATAHGWPARRPKTLRCERCKRKILVKPKGPLPLYCSHACRQRAYERNKWERPHLAHLRQDLDSAAMRAAIRQEAWGLLKQAGLVAEPERRLSQGASAPRCNWSRQTSARLSGSATTPASRQPRQQPQTPPDAPHAAPAPAVSAQSKTTPSQAAPPSPAAPAAQPSTKTLYAQAIGSPRPCSNSPASRGPAKSAG